VFLYIQFYDWGRCGVSLRPPCRLICGLTFLTGCMVLVGRKTSSIFTEEDMFDDTDSEHDGKKKSAGLEKRLGIPLSDTMTEERLGTSGSGSGKCCLID